MWPDVQDAQLVARNLKISSEDARSNWADAARIHCFLRFALDVCFNAGKHESVSMEELKTLAESKIGRKVNETAFRIGLQFSNLRSKRELVKLPPCHRLDQEPYAGWWKEELSKVEKEIAEEQSRRVSAA